MISVQLAKEVTRITLRRPEKRNALSLRLLEELRDAVEDARDGRPIVIDAVGATFTAGGDFAELKGDPCDIEMDDAIDAVTAAIVTAKVPVIAAIEGGCLGAGVDIALSCDARVGDTSTYFQLPAAALGLLYNPNGVARMAARTSPTATVRLLLLGERLNAREAMALHLLTHLCARGDVRQEALKLARSVSKWPAQAVAATKRFLVELQSGRDIETSAWQETLDSTDGIHRPGDRNTRGA